MRHHAHQTACKRKLIRGRGVRHARRAALLVIAGLNLRQPEIQNLGVPAHGDEQISGLDVSMRYARRMRRIQTLRDVASQTQQRV